MRSKKELLEFFEENYTTDIQCTLNIKSLGTVLDIIGSEEYFDYFINKNIYKIRNPYKRVYPIKLNKNLITNVLKRIEESSSISEINEDAEKEYCSSVIYLAIIMHKMGYAFLDEELSRVDRCYKKSIKSLDNKTKNAYQFLINKQKYSSVEIEKYSREMKECLELMNDDIKTKEFIHEIMRNAKMDTSEALMDIIKLNNKGCVHINKRFNINCSKISFIKEEIGRLGLDIENSKKQTKENDETMDRNTYDQKKRDEYKIIIDTIYESVINEVKSEDDLAYYLYRRLNEVVAYNTIAVSWSQKNQNVEKIINNDKSEDINYSNHYVTCHSWTDAMNDLLLKAGYESYIIGGNAHRYVVFFDKDNNLYVADGTNMPAGYRPSWLIFQE